METLIILGAAQVAKVTSDAHDFQTKAFSEMRGEKGDENARTSSILKRQDVSAKLLRPGLGGEQTRSTDFQIGCCPPRHRCGRLRNLLSRRCMNQVVCPRMSTPLPRLKEARRAEKGRTRGPDPSSLAIVSGVVLTVMRRVIVERRLLGSREQPGRRQFQAGEAKMKAVKAVRELCPSRSGQLRMRRQCVAPSVPSADTKGTASEIGKPGKGSRNRRCVNANPTRAEDLVPMRLTLK